MFGHFAPSRFARSAVANGNDPSQSELCQFYCVRCLVEFGDEPEAVDEWINGIPYCSGCAEIVKDDRV